MPLDIDLDGNEDLIVINWARPEFRVAFREGPETAFALLASGGAGTAAVLRAPNRPGLFAISVATRTSGFASSTAAVFIRSGCSFGPVTVDGKTLMLSEQRSRTSSQIDSTDLRCVAGNLVLAHLSVDQSGGRFQLDQRRAQLSGSSLTLAATEQQTSPTALGLPGDACLSESIPLAGP